MRFMGLKDQQGKSAVGQTRGVNLGVHVVQGSSLSCPGADTWTVHLPMLDS